MSQAAAKMFVEEYGPLAEQAGRELGVAPSIILSKWAMETNFGRSVPGQFNFGNIMDTSGQGTAARDRQTGSVDKYINFESPEAFKDYYVHFIKRLYPLAVNAGSDVNKFSEGLMQGAVGSYAGTKPDDYAQRIKNFQAPVTQFYKDPEETERGAKGATQEPSPNNPFATPIPGLEQVITKPAEQPIAPEPSGESSLVPVGAALGAAASSFGQVPFTPPGGSSPAMPGGGVSRGAPGSGPGGVSGGAPGFASRGSQASGSSLIPTPEQHQRAFQGTIKDTGITGRASQTTYNERTHDIAQQAKEMERVRQNLVRQGLVPAQEPTLPGAKASTPAGVVVPAPVAQELAHQRELQERRAQFRQQAQRALTAPAETTGAKAANLGFTKRAVTGAALGGYSAMKAQELIDLYNQGNRDPELLAALAAATGSSAAAALPAMGPRTARLKGAGLLGALPMMGYDLYKSFSDKRKVLEMEEELKRRAGQLQEAVKGAP